MTKQRRINAVYGTSTLQWINHLLPLF